MKHTLILLSVLGACSLQAQSVPTLQAEIVALQTKLKNDEALLVQLNQKVWALQRNPALALGPYVRIGDESAGETAPMITFYGVNIRIVNGAGQTGTANGLGNLIIGYDEVFSGYGPLPAGGRSGSHNLVLGTYNLFRGTGNLVMGEFNTANGTGGFVAGGLNTLSGNFGSILGGIDNQVSGNWSAICAGGYNYVTGLGSTVLGGYNNQEGDNYSTILGGTGKSDQTVVGYTVTP